MLRITYNGAELDLNTDTSLFLSYQAADLLGKIGGRKDVYSAAYSLPLTNNNRKAFGLIDSQYGDISAAFVLEPCQIYNDNTLILSGFAYVSDCDTNTINLNVTGGLKGFVDTIGEKELSELKFQPSDDYWLGNLIASHVAAKIGNVNLYDLLTYALWNDGQADKYDFQGLPIVPVSFFRPWWRVAPLIQLICQNAGYTVAGLSESNEDIAALAITGKTANADANWINTGLWKGIFTPAMWYWPDMPPIVTLAQQIAASDAPYCPYWTGGSTNAYNYNNFGYAKVEFSYNSYIHMVTPPGSGDPYFFWRAAVIQDDIYGTTHDPYKVLWESESHPYAPVEGSDEPIKTYTGSFVALINPNTNLRMVYYFTGVGGAGTFNFTWNPGPENDSKYFRVTPIDFLAPGSFITARCMPKLKQKDLLADFCNRLGLLLTSDEVSRQVILSPLSSLDTSGLDWSDKVFTPDNALTAGQYQTKFTYGSLAKRNYWKDANAAETGLITSEIIGIEAESTAFTSVLDTGADGVFCYNGLNLARYAIFDGGDKDFGIWKDLGGGLVYATGVVILNSGWYSVANGNNASGQTPAPPPYGINSYPVTNFHASYDYSAPEDVYSISDTPVIAKLGFADIGNGFWRSGIQINDPVYGQYSVMSGGVKVVTFADVKWPQALGKYSNVIQRMVQRPRIEIKLIRLRLPDVVGLDFSKPVTINGVQYFVNLIEQFNPITEAPCRVWLFRIPPR